MAPQMVVMKVGHLAEPMVGQLVNLWVVKWVALRAG